MDFLLYMFNLILQSAKNCCYKISIHNVGFLQLLYFPVIYLENRQQVKE